MTFWLTLAGMVAVTFGSRYAGLALQAELPDFWVRFLHFVPIAVFASLVTPSLEGGRDGQHDVGQLGRRVHEQVGVDVEVERRQRFPSPSGIGMGEE